MNFDPLCGRTIENVMSFNSEDEINQYRADNSSVYDKIYLELKGNEPFPEYDSKIEELEFQRQQEIEKALEKINKKFNILFEEANKLLEKRNILTRDEFSEWYNSLDQSIKNKLKNSIIKILNQNKKCTDEDDMYTLNEECSNFDSIYCVLAIDSGLIKDFNSHCELSDEFKEIEKNIISTRNKSASED